MIKNIIFDFGGVIYDISFSKLMKAFTQLDIPNAEALYTQNTQNKLFIDLEQGKISEKDFYSQFRLLSSTNLSDNKIESLWNEILLDYKDARIKTLNEIRKNYKCILMSNTNEIHYRYFSQQFRERYSGELTEMFDATYLSFKIKRSKPDPEIFHQILKEQNLKAEETLFIDDTKKNIDSILPLGIRGLHLIPKMDLIDLFQNGMLKNEIELA